MARRVTLRSGVEAVLTHTIANGQLWVRATVDGVAVDDDNGCDVGNAHFGMPFRQEAWPHHGRTWLASNSVFVLKGFRRQGLATAMYDYASAITGGAEIRPSDPRGQSPDGRAFWRQRRQRRKGK